MVNLNEPSIIILSRDLRSALDGQNSVGYGLKTFLNRNLNDRFALNFKNWLQTNKLAERSVAMATENEPSFNIYQTAIVILIQKALSGASIYDELSQIEEEYLQTCHQDIEKHVALLPMKLQIPLMLLILPSIMILIIFPALNLFIL